MISSAAPASEPPAARQASGTPYPEAPNRSCASAGSATLLHK